MTQKTYDEYKKEGAARAAQVYQKWLLPLLVLGGAVGAFIGSRVGSGGPVFIGAVAGALVGFLIQLFLRYNYAGETADHDYAADWCAENGCQLIGEYQPVDGPHATSGFKQRSSDAVQGTLNGMPTVFYNFSYWTHDTDSEGHTTETEHPFKIIQITGPTLPIDSLSFSTRGMFNKFHFVDSIESKTTSQRNVELESVEFNKKFDLMVDDKADDIWIRRVFDPATIDGCVTGALVIPNIKYYDASWWLIDSKHYKVEKIEDMKVWQGAAVIAITQLARIPAG